MRSFARRNWICLKDFEISAVPFIKEFIFVFSLEPQQYLQLKISKISENVLYATLCQQHCAPKILLVRTKGKALMSYGWSMLKARSALPELTERDFPVTQWRAIISW